MRSSLSMIFFVTLLVLFSCSGKPKKSNDSTINSDTSKTDLAKAVTSYSFAYDLKNPSEKFKLPDQLTEISGIDIYKKSKLVCVQDEKGKVYIYDAKTGEIAESMDFAEKGDYEGVANVRDTIWVLSSNGNLHRISDLESQNRQIEEFKTPLNADNDTEGLCYDDKNNRLLIACKAKAGKDLKGIRAIYAFDLKSKTISSAPVNSVKIDDLKAFLMQHDKEKFITDELKSLLDPDKGDPTFQPSEVHLHPITDEIYLISSVGNLLLIIDRNNKIKYITKLDPGIFKQPEGITFENNGTMYISDEGRDGHGNILKFNYQANAK